MPGPIFSITNSHSDSFDTFQSCEDVQEAWGCNGNSTQGTSRYIKRNGQGYRIDYSKVKGYTNGSGADKTMAEEAPYHTERVLEEEEEEAEQEEPKYAQGVNKIDATADRQMTCLQECQEDMELEEETEQDAYVTESINIPVVEARLSVDISSALTRQKIASIQRGRTLSYVDREDSEESPTRRNRPLFHNRESIEFVVPIHKALSADSSPNLPPKTERSSKVSRNPSYHSAVKSSAAVDSTVDKPLTFTMQHWSSSSEGSPGHELAFASADNIGDMSSPENSILTALPHFKKNQPLDLPVAANIPRSASFSGGCTLSPTLPANGSYRDIYGRRGSISQPSTPVTKRAHPPLLVPKETTNLNIPARGSVITRSFRRLFSTPVKTASTSVPTSYPEDYWIDLPELDSPSPSDSRSTSRLRKLSSTLTRKLSTRTKMSNSYTFPSNGHHMGINGEMIPDSRTLVDYEGLMKIFSCSGCQSIMAPPLHQCRKGHLVCSTCRFSLKQVCPICKQRFAENTNLMMEKVCNLVKFPCRWSSSGCPEFHTPKSRLDHEHFCCYRPLHCHHAPRGCTQVLILREMQQHVDACEYKDK